MRMFDRAFRQMTDAEQGGLAGRIETLHPVQLAWMLQLTPAAHEEPQSELVEAVARWLQSECVLGDGHAMTHREAVAAFERFAGTHHCRRAFGRVLASQGFSFAVARGRRKWFGVALRELIITHDF